METKRAMATREARGAEGGSARSGTGIGDKAFSMHAKQAF